MRKGSYTLHSGVIMIKNFLHIGIGVFDLQESVRFYTEVMGAEKDYVAKHSGEKISRVVGVPNANLDVEVVKIGDVKLELIDYGNDKAKAAARGNLRSQDIPGLLHFAVSVDDVMAEYERIKAMGYRFFSEPMVTRENGPLICYFEGPDNVVIELYQKMH
jgi:catechol 2,3-dioxygenase-like lactoylglutathione lyase family enzyme